MLRLVAPFVTPKRWTKRHVAGKMEAKEGSVMTFSEKILNLRKARNMSQEELAERLEVSRQAIVLLSYHQA